MTREPCEVRKREESATKCLVRRGQKDNTPKRQVARFARARKGKSDSQPQLSHWQASPQRFCATPNLLILFVVCAHSAFQTPGPPYEPFPLLAMAWALFMSLRAVVKVSVLVRPYWGKIDPSTLSTLGPFVSFHVFDDVLRQERGDNDSRWRRARANDGNCLVIERGRAFSTTIVCHLSIFTKT